MERRISARFATRVDVGCRMPATPQCALVRDLSLEGCRLELATTVQGAGGSVMLDLTPHLSVSGTVVWAEGREAGVLFHEPLDLGRFAVQDFIDLAREDITRSLLGTSEVA